MLPKAKQINSTPSTVPLARTLQQVHKRQGECKPSQTWLLRGTILGFVLAFHVIAVVFLMLPPLIKPMSATTEVTSEIKVQFFKPTPKPPVSQKRTTSSFIPGIAARQRPHPIAKRLLLATPLPTSESVPVTNPSQTNTPVQMTLSQGSPLPVDKTYVPGGDLLKGKNMFNRAIMNLPGGVEIKGAPQFQMADPKMQGLAGVIHFIGGLAGAVDRDCVDLDAWQGMTPEERIENHVSEDDIEKIRDRHNCKALRASH